MTRFLKAAIAACVLATMASCTIYTTNNGKLDGHWYLIKVDTLSTGGSVNYREQRVFWAFQDKLLQMRSVLDDVDTYYFFRFQHTGNTLIVNQPHRYDRLNGDIEVTADSLKYLRQKGINYVDEYFDVEKLTSDEMVLSDDTLRLYFENY